MAIDYPAIQNALIANISAAMESNLDQQYASLPLPATALTGIFVWQGTATVNAPDTSEVAVDQYIRLDADGAWYKITAVTPDVSITISDTYAVGSFPTGSGGSSTANIDPPPPLTGSGSVDSLAEAIAVGVMTAIEAVMDSAEISGTTAGTDTIGPGVIS